MQCDAIYTACLMAFDSILIWFTNHERMDIFLGVLYSGINLLFPPHEDMIGVRRRGSLDIYWPGGLFTDHRWMVEPLALAGLLRTILIWRTSRSIYTKLKLHLSCQSIPHTLQHLHCHQNHPCYPHCEHCCL